jgi:cytochrome c553
MRVLSWMTGINKRILCAGVAGFALALPGAQAQVQTVRPDAARGSQLFEQGDTARGIVACASCHGPGGNSAIPTNPNLAGMPREYLAKQLTDFQQTGDKPPARRGAGGNPAPMTALVQPLSEQDRQDLALYLSQQPLKEPSAASDKSLVERGQQIWRAGRADRGVPSCAGCHGANGAGIPGRYPRLSGQFPAYLESQLRLFRSGDRGAGEPMHDITDRMTDADIHAVADYAAGLR